MDNTIENIQIMKNNIERKRKTELSLHGQNIIYRNWVYEESPFRSMRTYGLRADTKLNDNEITDIVVKTLSEYPSLLSDIESSVFEGEIVTHSFECYIQEERGSAVVYLERRGIRCVIILGTSDIAEEIREKLSSSLPLVSNKRFKKNYVSVITKDKYEGFKKMPFRIKECSFDPKNYTQKITEGYQRLNSKLKADHQGGRFILLRGLPGTGKTYFIRSLINSVKGEKIFIPSHMTAHMLEPSMIELLLEKKKGSENDRKFLIFEDAENLLMKRQTDNSSFVSVVLNFADGILAELANSYIIATTNIKNLKEIDEAILRPGRLLELLEFEALDKFQANELHESLTGNPGVFLADTTLAEVYKQARGEETNDIRMDTRAGFAHLA